MKVTEILQGDYLDKFKLFDNPGDMILFLYDPKTHKFMTGNGDTTDHSDLMYALFDDVDEDDLRNYVTGYYFKDKGMLAYWGYNNGVSWVADIPSMLRRAIRSKLGVADSVDEIML